jgi:mycofactocin system glycosyltransferase
VSAFPGGLRITLDGDARWFDDVLVGGSPRRALKLTPEGRRTVAVLCTSGAKTPAAAQLARRLLDAGIAHPEPGAAEGELDLTVIVPVRDRAAELDRCLAALGDGAPVVVVDDGSRDPKAIRSVCDGHGAILIRRETSGGPAAARNDALLEVETELVAFCDSDCEPEPGWIRALAAHFEDPLVAAVAPRVVPRAPALHATWVQRYASTRSPLDMGPRPGQVAPGGRISYVPTAALVVRHEAIGRGFDPGLRFGEDVDLVWRMHDAGRRIRYEPRVIVPHSEPARPGALLLRRFGYGASAAPLARRHPGRLAHVSVPRPGDRSIRRAVQAGIPWSRALAWSGAATARSLTGLSRAATSLAWPLVAAGLLRRSTRPASAVLLAISAFDSWRRHEPDLDPLRWSAAAFADDAAYGAGVWRGCLRERTLDPIRARVR